MAIARRQAAAITRDQLRAELTEDQVEGLLRRREVARAHGTVYVHAASPSTNSQRLWVAILWSGGIVSHRSAAKFWGVELPWSDTVVHVTAVDRRLDHPPAYVKLHRVPLSSRETTLIAGLPVTTRTRTIIDLLRTERDGMTILDRAIQLGWITEAGLRQEVDSNPGRHGNVKLRALLNAIEPGAHAESERVLHRLLTRARITGWQPQLAVRLRSQTAFVDAGFEAERVAIEVDGRRYHGADSERFESDRIRQNGLVADGWLVLRFTWRRLNDDGPGVVREIRAALRARRAA